MKKIFSKILLHIGKRGRGLLFETNCLSFFLYIETVFAFFQLLVKVSATCVFWKVNVSG